MGRKSSAANATGSEELHAAARSGDLKAVETICSANPLAVNSRDRHSRTPLHLAAWSGHTEVVGYLCKNRADIGAAAMDDMGAIHFAAQKGHLEVIKILITSGVSVKSSNRKGMTALHYAAQGSNLELVKYLLKKGANKDSKNKAKKSAVDLASSEEVRRLLVQYKPEPGKAVQKADENDEKLAANVGSQDKMDEHETDVSLHQDESAEDEKDETLNRKGEEEIEGNQDGTKKPKVSLNHLLAADDTREEEENN